jgi:periplasmic divalent cation tolerance protein
MTTAVVGLVTCGSRAEARKVARAVSTAKAAACVNIVPGAESHYWWQGKLERAPEFLLVVKTTRAKCREVVRVVQAAHSYEVPEIIFLPIVKGERRYMKWLQTTVAVLLLAMPARADRVDELLGKLGAAEEETRADAADGLARIGGPRVLAKFRELIASENPERRQMGVAGLLQVSEDDADVERVRGRLSDENSTVRWTAALALASAGRTEAVPWLEEVARTDALESVREAAAEAAGKLRAGIAWQRSLPAALQ